MPAAQEILLRILGDSSSAKKAIGDIDGATGGLTRSMSGIGSKIAAAFSVTAITAFSVAAVKAAGEAEVSQARLQKAVENAGYSWGAYSDQIQNALEKQMMLGAYDDEELADSLSRLVTVTGNVTDALDLNSLAMDIARGTGKDLESTAVMLGKVYSGNVGVLKRFGISVGDVKSGQEALSILQQKFAGQAEAYGNTTAGAMEKIKIALGEIKEAFGAGIIEGFKETSSIDMSNAGAQMLQFAESAKIAGEAVGNLVGWLTKVIEWTQRRELKEAQDMAAWDKILGKDEAAQGWLNKAAEIEESLKRMKGDAEGTAGANAGLAASSTNAAGAMGEEASAADQLSDSLAASHDATLSLYEAQVAQERAQLRVSDATKAYNEALKTHDKNSREAKDASLDLRDAKLNLARANDRLKDAENKAAEAADTAADKTVAAAKSIAEKATAALKAASDAAKREGMNFARGFALGISQQEARAVEAAEQLVMRTVAAARAAQQSKSPSKVMAQVGGEFVAGFELGIEQGIPAGIAKANKLLTGSIEVVLSGVEKLGMSITNAFGGIFGTVGTSDYASGDTLLGNLQTQVGVIQRWQSNLQKLASMGFSNAALEMITGQGPQAWAKVEGLLGLSPDQVSQWNAATSSLLGAGGNNQAIPGVNLEQQIVLEIDLGDTVEKQVVNIIDKEVKSGRISVRMGT